MSFLDEFFVDEQSVDGCGVTIYVDGFSHVCEREIGHEGSHISRIKVDRNYYAGFDWTDEEAELIARAGEVPVVDLCGLAFCLN